MNRANRPTFSRISGSSYASNLLGRAGDGSTLSLDFTTGVLDPRLTFTRTSGGTYVANDGYIYGMDFATSSSLAIGTGSKSVTLTATAGVDRRYLVGQTVYISNGANNMSGPVTAYNASTQVLTINATATTGSGSFTSWTVGNASPRFDYDPPTLAPQGLRIEGQATNLVQYSEGLSQNPWFNVSNVTRTLNVGGIAPDGTNNAASRIGMSGPIGASSSLYYNGVTVTNQQYTHSVFAKADGADWIYLWVETSGSVAYGAYFNLTGNGSVGNLVGSGTTARIEKFPNGWYRCQTTSTQPAGTTYPCLLPSTGNLTGRSSMIGTTPGSFLVWGDQFEAASGASSLVPTGASQVTRNADYCTMPVSSFITGSPYPNTLYVDAIPNTPSAAFVSLARLFDRVTNFAHGSEIYYYSAASMIVQRKITASANTERSFATGLTYGSRHKFAMSIDASSFLGSYDGVTGLGTTTAPTALPTSVTHLGVGCAGDSTPTGVMFGTIRQIKFWPSALPQATINALTTL